MYVEDEDVDQEGGNPIQALGLFQRSDRSWTLRLKTDHLRIQMSKIHHDLWA